MEDKKKRVRKSYDYRKDQIICAAINICDRDGFDLMTRDSVANEANLSGGHINFIFGNVKELRKEVIKHAIKTENLKVLSSGLSFAADPEIRKVALKAPDGLKRQALELLLLQES